MGAALGNILSSAVGGVLGIGSNMINNAQNADLTYTTQARQNEFQAEQNQFDREWQYETWMKQFETQQNEWLKQFDITNQYNNPKELMKRLMDAGINPAAAISSLTGQAGLSSASPNAFSPGSMGSHSVTPSSFNANGWEKPSAAFSSIAQLGDTIAKLTSVGLDTTRQKAILNAEVDKTLAESDALREQSILTKVNRNLQEIFGKEKIGAEISNLVSQSYAAKANGDLSKANELYSSALERLTSIQSEGYAKQLPFLISNLEELGKLYQTQQKANVASAKASIAQASASYAAAEYHHNLSLTESALRDGRVKAQDLANEINGFVKDITREDSIFKRETRVDRLTQFTNELERQQLINRELGEKIKKAITDNDWQAVEKMVGVASSVIGNVVSLRSVGAQELNALNGSVRNEIQSRIADQLERNVFTQEEFYPGSDGSYVRRSARYFSP